MKSFQKDVHYTECRTIDNVLLGYIVASTFFVIQDAFHELDTGQKTRIYREFDQNDWNLTFCLDEVNAYRRAMQLHQTIEQLRSQYKTY